jgi:hypothetical protein
MKSKNKIMDSFEEFIKEHVSILKHRIIQITGYRSDFIDTKSINLEIDDNVVRINCINNENAYNLLSSVIYKRKINQKRRLNENKECEISSKLA